MFMESHGNYFTTPAGKSDLVCHMLSFSDRKFGLN